MCRLLIKSTPRCSLVQPVSYFSNLKAVHTSLQSYLHCVFNSNLEQMNFKLLFKTRISLLEPGVGGREKDRNECEMDMGRNALQRPPLALPPFHTVKCGQFWWFSLEPPWNVLQQGWWGGHSEPPQNPELRHELHADLLVLLCILQN